MATSQGEINHGQRPPFPSDLTILDLMSQHAAATPDALALVLPVSTPAKQFSSCL